MQERLNILLLKIIDNHKEKEFIQSLLNYYTRKGYLTDAQENYLKKIEDKYFEATLESDRLWKEEYKSNIVYQENAKYASQYYLALGSYYKDLSNKIMNKQYIPTRKEYESLCENKYTLRLIDEIRKPRLIHDGDIVQVRKTCNLYDYVDQGRQVKYFRNEYGICLGQAPDPIVMAHVGAKKYIVRLFNIPKMLTLEERWLKRAKSKKET